MDQKKQASTKKVPTRLMKQNLPASAIQLILKSGEGALDTSLRHNPEMENVGGFFSPSIELCSVAQTLVQPNFD
jgi:hypothetical protein